MRVQSPVNLDEQLLYNKMYDRFTLEFNNMQIIVAKVRSSAKAFLSIFFTT